MFIELSIGCSENKSVVQYLLLVNEAQAAVVVPRPPADLQDLKTTTNWKYR